MSEYVLKLCFYIFSGYSNKSIKCISLLYLAILCAMPTKEMPTTATEQTYPIACYIVLREQLIICFWILGNCTVCELRYLTTFRNEN